MNDRDRSPDSTIDAETLAAFLEGRLGEEERARVLEHLADSEEDYETFLEAVHVTGELEAGPAAGERPGTDPEGEEGGGGAPPGPFGAEPPASGRRLPALQLLAAAAVAALVIGGSWYLLRPGPDLDRGPHALVAALDAEVTQAPGWDAPAWPVLRAPEEPAVALPPGERILTPEARAFRLGVRFAHLEAAARERNEVAFRRLVEELAVLAGGLPGGGPLSALYRELARLSPGSDEEVRLRREAWRATEDSVAVGELRLGAWVGAARIALAARDAAWFRTRAAREGTRWVDAEALAPQTRETWRAVAELAAADPVDTDALDAALASLGAAVGR